MTKAHQKPSQDNVIRAYETIKKYESWIRALIQSSVQSGALAEDIFHDLFLSLVQKPVPEKIRNVRGYLYRAVTNDIIDAYRKNKRHRGCLEKLRLEAGKCHSQYESADDIAETEERKRMFDLISETLPGKQAIAIRLRFDDGMSAKQAAEVMGIKPRSVDRYVCMGIRKLRQVFRDSTNPVPHGRYLSMPRNPS